MGGVAIIRALLVVDAGVLALVPPERIMAGELPQGTALTALAVSRVSAMDRNILSPVVTRHVRERVTVTAMAASYPAMKAALAAAKHACADFIGTVAGLSAVAVHSDVAGPDVMDEQSSIHIGSQDFMVEYSETR